MSRLRLVVTAEAEAAPDRGAGVELFGREADCRAIDDLLRGVLAGAGGALLLWGEPGIGKTALMRYGVERGAAMTLLSARGIEAESELPFAGLSEVLRPVLDLLPSLSDRQAAALASALAIGPPTGDDPFATGMATLSLLAAACASRPVLVAVDDLQWLDTSSADALLFAARRVRGEPIAFLIAMRDGTRAEPPALDIPARRLSGLDRAASRRLLAMGAAAAADSDLLDRLVTETGGNPLALIEIPALLERELLDGRIELRDEPLPLGERLRRAFAARASGLPRRTQTSLLVMAANDGPDVEAALRAMTSLGLSPGDLAPAEAIGLLSDGDTSLAFRHPLMRSAVYHAADPALRRQAHGALATALAGEHADLVARRAWHLAAATLGEDDAVASALEEVAVSARHRSGYPAAARAYERAGRLSTSPEARARRFLAAAQAWQLANQCTHAMSLLDEATRLTADRLLQADIQHTRALVDTWRGPALDASRDLRTVAEGLRSLSPGRAAAMLSDATLASITGGDLGTALEAAERANEIAAPLGGAAAVTAKLQLGKARILTADVRSGYPLLMAAVEELGRLDLDGHGA
ncbi:MAG TPA: AAA family ATPase, partial [Candidatus Binatus sp.]|nr:AAA family ATPase [Candidatus Binatus sp.]